MSYGFAPVYRTYVQPRYTDWITPLLPLVTASDAALDVVTSLAASAVQLATAQVNVALATQASAAINTAASAGVSVALSTSAVGVTLATATAASALTLQAAAVSYTLLVGAGTAASAWSTQAVAVLLGTMTSLPASVEFSATAEAFTPMWRIGTAALNVIALAQASGRRIVPGERAQPVTQDVGDITDRKVDRTPDYRFHSGWYTREFYQRR